jgi:hypothetical protein
MAEPVPPTHSPSKFPQALQTQLAGLPGTIGAIAVALTAAVGAWQGYQGNQSTTRSAYETLKATSDQQTVQIAALVQGQLELKSWTVELAARLERQQATVAEAVRPARVRQRKPDGTPAATPPTPVLIAPAEPTEPPPPPPATPLAPLPATLPAFDALK